MIGTSPNVSPSFRAKPRSEAEPAAGGFGLRHGIQLCSIPCQRRSWIPDRARHHAFGVIKVRVRNDDICKE